MLNIDSLSKGIANKIGIELNFDKDQVEVIAYGTFVFFQTLFSIIITIVFGFMFSVTKEALIVSFIGSIFRKSSGGVHASSPGRCTTIGTAVCVGAGILVKFMLIQISSLNIIIILGILAFTWSYYITYKLAPVDSSSKPIKKQENINRLKKKSIIILSVYLMIVLIILAIYVKTREKNLITYILCIYAGMAWQVFTLTRKGHLVVHKIDIFLSNIFKFLRRYFHDKTK